MKIGDGRIFASQLAILLARTMGMYWRKVGCLYYLGCSPVDPEVKARSSWLSHHSKGLKEFLNALSSSPIYEGINRPGSIADPEPVCDADMGVLRSLSKVMEDTSKWAKNGTNPKGFLHALQNDNFRLRKFRLWMISSMMVSNPPFRGTKSISLSKGS